jgi:glyoxylase-like metal-dependent hydrolase (beta-lactamase superfamily II)
MLFTLEALQAEHGDSLLLHYGDAIDPKLIVIDGGPPLVWGATLRPRLEDLRATLVGDGSSLPIELMMVSHIDDDHIGGLLGMTRTLCKAAVDGEPLPYDVLALWHNAFSDLLDDDNALGAVASASAVGGAAASNVVAAAMPIDDDARPARAVVASVDEGRRLRDDARFLEIAVNPGFDGLVRRANDAAPLFDLGHGLTFEVIGPSPARLAALREEWQRVLRRKQHTTSAAWLAEAASFADKSVFNLASIVGVARVGGRSILLSGDARGDHMLDALRDAGLVQNGVTHFDVFKVPHHGSDRNVTTEFFEKVTADHYVISANGKHGNPDPPMLEMLLDARGSAEYTIHLTNAVPHAVDFLRHKRAGRRFGVLVRPDSTASLRIDLDEPLPTELEPGHI